MALPSPEFIDALSEELEGAGVRIVRGTYVDSAGVLRAKEVSLSRLGAFAAPGLGAAPSWAVFCVDDAIAFTPPFSAVGDMRLRLDLDAVRRTDATHAWGPVELVDQDGSPMGFCPRTALRRQLARAQSLGIAARAAIELEFVCFDAESNSVLPGVAYGVRPLLESSAFLDDVHAAFDLAGLPLEQLHAEYGAGQFELSLPPLPPLAAVDAHVCARILVSEAARHHGRRVSFSPQALAEGIGNGAHVHLSFDRGGRPLLSGGDAPHGLTEDGASIVGSLVAGLPDAIGVLAPSALSRLRLQPGHWAGAFGCWGLENREAAIRLCAATAGNPHGAHVEVKCVDPSANMYAAVATLVGLALDGLEERRPLPAEITVDPQTFDDELRAQAGITALGDEQASTLDMLERSATISRLLGDDLVNALVAVRRHEVDMSKRHTEAELVELLRFAWSP
jgi:glutamine synthetase